MNMGACDNVTDTNQICSTLESTGTGFGAFLSAIVPSLVYFFIILLVLGGIAGLFMKRAIPTVFFILVVILVFGNLVSSATVIQTGGEPVKEDSKLKST